MLSGVRVLDLSDESGFLAGKILGDLGADVIKIEAPGGDIDARRGPYLRNEADPEKSLLWLALNTSKRGITLDLKGTTGRSLFQRLVATADVLLESFPVGRREESGIGVAELRREHPRLIHCSISPFGRDGPYARFRAHDLVVVAMGGNASMTGDPDRPPLRCSMPTAYYHAGPEAALGVVMALLAREETGRGQLVDVSLQECQLGTLIAGPGLCALLGEPPRRSGARTGRTREIWPTRDGHISFGLRGGPARLPNLIATAAYMAECDMAPAWLREYDWEQFNHNTLSDEEIERFEAAFGDFFRTRTMRELYEEALRRRILLAPCNNPNEVLAHPQLRAREFFVTLEYPELDAAIEHPQGFARSSRGGIGIRRRAPRIGEHNGEIFGELGMEPSEVEKLAARGVV